MDCRRISVTAPEDRPLFASFFAVSTIFGGEVKMAEGRSPSTVGITQLTIGPELF